jgi:hypothetical protein
MSTPLLGFLLFHDNYLFECVQVQHHSGECAGYCVLKKELASQGHRNADTPEPALQKQLKVIDLFFVRGVQVPLSTSHSTVPYLQYSSGLLDLDEEILSPPPRFV